MLSQLVWMGPAFSAASGGSSYHIVQPQEFLPSHHGKVHKGYLRLPRMPEEEYGDLYKRNLLTDQQVQDHNCPGPFSFLGYLRSLLELNFWGDELCLCLLSMAFQIRITVVNAEGFTHIRFRHKQDIPLPLQETTLCAHM